MNRQELQNKLNELLVGKQATYNYDLCKIVEAKLGELGLNNEQGIYGVRHDNYTLTITYKRHALVSFDIKKKADNVYRWVVKEVIVDTNFVDYDTSVKTIKDRLKKTGDTYDENRFYNSSVSFEELKTALRYIRSVNKGKTKEEIRNLIHNLEWSYWVVDEALESEKDYE